MATKTDTIKTKARELIEQLPDTATWDDVAYKIHVRQLIERGLRNAEAGRLTDRYQGRQTRVWSGVKVRLTDDAVESCPDRFEL